MGKIGDLLVYLLMLLCGLFVVLYLVNLLKKGVQGSGDSTPGSQDAAEAAGRDLGQTVGAGATGAAGGVVQGVYNAGSNSVIDFFANLLGMSQQTYLNDAGEGLKQVGAWFGHPEWFDNGTSDSQFADASSSAGLFDEDGFSTSNIPDMSGWNSEKVRGYADLLDPAFALNFLGLPIDQTYNVPTSELAYPSSY